MLKKLYVTTQLCRNLYTGKWGAMVKYQKCCFTNSLDSKTLPIFLPFKVSPMNILTLTVSC